MKKFLLTLLTVALAVCSIVFVGAACSDNTESGNDKIYTVTFDSDGGTPVEKQKVTDGKKAKEPDIPVKTGYTFAGWFVKTTEWNFLAYTVTENVTLKAKWIANTYKITFDTAGGKILSDMEVTYNEAYTLPIPEKEDYVFIGWKENETDFSQSELWDRTSGVKLTAKWVIAKSTITFDSDGAGEVPPMTINYKEDYTLPVITKKDYKFICWTLNGVKFENGTVLTGDITLIAKWERVTDSFKYSETKGEITITEFIGSATDVIVPGAINGKPVTAIGEDVFKNNTKITSVTFDGAFNNYTEKMFEGCTSIKKLTISGVYNKALYYLFGDNINDVPESLTEISFAKNSAYYDGAMFKQPVANHAVTYVVPEGTTSIPDNMFNGCGGLKTVTIPDSVTSIGHGAFYGCSSLTNITIPDSVTSIGYQAFYGCNKLIKEESGIKYIDNWIIGVVNSTLLTANIKYGTRGISNGAFFSCISLKDLIIPDSVTSIGDSAFMNCSNLTNITIPYSVTSIGDSAFMNCSNLTTITIPNSVTSVGEWAFCGCSSLASVTIGNDVTSIGNHAFYNCTSLTNVTIGNSVTSIGIEAFSRCTGLTTITIPDSVTSIGDWAFWQCFSLKSVTIGNSVKNISKGAFSDCTGLTNVTIGNSVINIDEYAFAYCDNLTSITIGNSVTSISDNEFNGCVKLVEVINNSSLNITKGSTENGYIAYYALTVKKGGTSDIVNKNDYLFYTYDNVNYLLGYVGESNDLVLPNDYNGENYAIYDYAFYGCSSLTSVIIGNSVTSIGDYAFSHCSGLSSIAIPNSVTSIGDWAFEQCFSLKSVTIGNSVKSIGDSAFNSCQLVEVINNSSLSITKGSLDNGGIACHALTVKKGGTSDIVNKNDYLFYTYDNVNYLLGYIGESNDLVLPNDYNGENYAIYDYAFFGCSSLTSINIPDSVTNIGEYAFYGCSRLTSVTIGNGVTSIGYGAFCRCSNLTNITIPNSVTSIGYQAFDGCNKLIKEESGIKYVDTWIVGVVNNTILTANIKDGTRGIGNSAFYNCSNLTTITIPDSVTSIGEWAFYNCSSLKNVTIGNSVTSIGYQAFYYCSSLKNVTIGNSVTSIGYLAFAYCESLTTITIPDSVTSIGDCAFSGCNKLIKEESGIKYVDTWIIGVVNSTLLTANIKYGTRGIGNSAFYNCSSLKNVTIPDSVTSIGSEAFRGCTGLTTITVPESVTSIGDQAFYDCRNLISVTIGNNVTSIGNLAFLGCSSLTSVTIGNSVKSIGDSAFMNCNSLTSITIPDSVTSIGHGAFIGCNNLTSITIPDSVTSVGNSAFLGCNNLTSITIPDSVTSIGERAFCHCKNLKTITIPDSVTSIGNSAFKDCSRLTSVTIPDSVTSIGKNAFYACSELKTINYKGDEKQWNSISKDEEWDNGAGSYTINYNYKEEN